MSAVKLGVLLIGLALAVASCASPLREKPQPSGPAGPAAQDLGPLRQQMLAAVNRVRSARGLGALRLAPELNAAAQAHAADLAPRGSISHTGSDGSNAGHRALRAGYDYRKVAENTAQGHANSADVVAAWMDSPEHRANMLVADMTELGVGFAKGVATPGVPGRYWVILLGRR